MRHFNSILVLIQTVTLLLAMSYHYGMLTSKVGELERRVYNLEMLCAAHFGGTQK